MNKDIRVDVYIKKSALFAQPILKHLRALLFEACPNATETIKWGMPSYDYHGPMLSIAAFKAHCMAAFWKSKLLLDKNNYLGERKNNGGEAMGNFGRITSINDLPPKEVFLDFVKQHMLLNESGIKVKKKEPVAKVLVVPPELKQALAKNERAKIEFDAFSVSQKREYADWIADAKSDVTRNKRLADAVEWISEGKIRNWKYHKTKKSR